MNGYLIDTSIFIAFESGREVGAAPSGAAKISVATLTELLMGAELATGDAQQVRESTLANAESFIALSFDEYVAKRLAVLLAAARTAGRRAGLMDAIIAATAIVHDLAVWTQDDDFEVLAKLAPELEVARA